MYLMTECYPDELAPRQPWLLAATDADCPRILWSFLAHETNASLKGWLCVTERADTLQYAHCFGQVRPGRQLSRILGDEFSGIVLDWRLGWNLNHLSQVVGALVAGGHLIVLLSETRLWESLYGWVKGSPARFFQYWVNEWLAAGARWITPETPPKPVSKLPDSGGGSSMLRLSLTSEQRSVEHALLAMPHTDNHPIIVTGPRGSGKTTVMAHAANQLVGAGHAVLVTGALTDQLRGLRAKLIEGVVSQPWERLDTSALERSVVLVDEAAVLGLERLRWLARAAPKSAFFSTVEGYEGSGQGFLLRFLPWLYQFAASYERFFLSDSLRWSADDPVSVAYRASTLQSTESRDSLTPVDESFSGSERVDPADSLTTRRYPDWVRLLSEAHYQTRPEDIRQCIDDPDVLAWARYSSGRVVGLLVALREPPVSPQFAKDVWRGHRRPGGQLAKQSLIGQLGYLEAGSWAGLRIWRLVVDTDWRRQGLGRSLVRTAQNWAKESGYAYIAASYGLTRRLSCFWNRSGFRLVRVGTRADPSSGEYSALELFWAMSDTPAPGWVPAAGTLIGERFLLSPPGTVGPAQTALMLSLAQRLEPPPLRDHECHRLQHWCASEQPDNSLFPTLSRALWHLVRHHRLSEGHQVLWVERLWLNRSWSELQATHRFADRHRVVRGFRRSLKDGLADQIFRGSY